MGELGTRIYIAHELHEGNEGTGVLQNAPTRLLTPKSINAFVFCDDNRNNLGQLEVVSCGRNGNASKYYCPRMVRIVTNAKRGLIEAGPVA